jgi:cellulose synthase operon protein C
VHLADVIGHWIGKVEIVLAGADDDLRSGQDALTAGDALGARAAARRVLERVPDSPLGLALLADACEAGHLEAELAVTLEDLARRAPSRAEVWVRLAEARGATGASVDEVRDAFVRALAVAESGTEARLDALIGLADLDLVRGDGARAELWLERAAPTAHPSPEIATRFAEACLLRGDARGAMARLVRVQAAPADGRAALVRGRTLAMLGDGEAFVQLVRAMVLDVPGASEALSSALSYIPSDALTRERVRDLVDAKGEQHLARWRAAFARAVGARDTAREALREAVSAGDTAASRPLLEAAIEDRNREALDAALRSLPEDDEEPLLVEARRLLLALPTDGDRGTHALDAVIAVGHPRLAPWAQSIVGDVARAWIPASGAPTAWAQLLARFDAHAHAIGDAEAAASTNDLAAERSRPVRLAIVGEFNAGKTTFINALIGEDVAPTGVLPTTATLHHLRWAPDPFARILFERGHVPTERLLPLGDLRTALRQESAIRRVELCMPLPSLARVEILDTPGYNSLEPGHARIARSALDEADAALWLLDATQTLKESERVLLEEAQRAGLPVQLLVNKTDRITAPDLARVMEAVHAGTADMRIDWWSPPLALSAKRALAGKLGDARALEESGWSAIQALLEERVVARSDELKERSLRRRASLLVARLAAAWNGRVDAEDTAARERATRAHDASRAATRIEQDAHDIAARLAASLAPRVTEWAHSLEVVFVGRDRDAAARDQVLARYRIDRAVDAIAPALSQAIAALAPEAGVSPPQLAACARAVVRAAAWSAPDVEAMLAAISRAGVAALVDQLTAASIPSASPTRASATGVLRELRVFAVALQT